MSRINTIFAELAVQNRKGLIPFITAGDPDVATTVQLMHALVRGGADVIELGVPFSDPMADGPVIQRASERALKHGVGMVDVLQCVREFRKNNDLTAVVLMGYANPIERMGVQKFVAACAESGVDGVLVVDYPPEECVEYAACMKAHGVDVIYLLAPTSTDARIRQVAAVASGYVYYVSLKGVTGDSVIDLTDVTRMLTKLRQELQVPIAVGFGIRDGATAKLIAGVSDAVVIGSRIIQEIESQQDHARIVPAVQEFLQNIRSTMDQ